MATQYGDLTADLSSGLIHIDALLGSQPHWWLNNLSAGNVIRFAFPAANTELELFKSGPGGYQPFTAAQRDGARRALAMMGEITGVQFQEMADPAAADLFFGQASLAEPGLNRFHWTYSTAGDTLTAFRVRSFVYLSTGALGNGFPLSGTWAFDTLLQEIGHAMGLKHPDEGPVRLPGAEDTSRTTVMSHNRTLSPRSYYQAYDLAALHYLYGGDGLRGTYGVAPGNTGLVLEGTAAADRLVGSDGADQLDGSFGDDLLDGGPGADLMFGGHGDDTFIVDHAGDKFGEAAGTDQVISSVTLSLVGQTVERATLTGATDLDLTGNGISNTLTGNAGRNRITGGNGGDLIRGGGGSDLLTGNNDRDRFRYATPADGGDTITDFVSGSDRIEVTSGNFNGLRLGYLAPGHFALDRPKDTDDYFVFDTATHRLSFDADGNRSGAAVTLATLTGSSLTAGDIVVVAKA